MGWRCVFVFIFALAIGNAEAMTFEPAVDSVCKVTTGKHPEFVLNRDLLKQELNRTKGAIEVDLLNFLNRHRKPTDPQKGGIDTTSLAISGEGSTESLRIRSAYEFLEGHGTVTAKCVKPLQSVEMPANGDKTDGAAPPTFISLRQTVDDLKYSQGSDQWKAAKTANLSASNDRIANKYSVSIDSALGYVFPISIDEYQNTIGKIIPFITYNQQFVQTATPKTSSYTENAGVGVTGDVLLFKSHDIAFTPKYIESVRNHGELLSGTVAYTPMYGIPGVDNVYYIITDTLSFLITPQLKYVFRDITNAGTDITFLSSGNYSWYGSSVNMILFGEGILGGFSYNIAYEQYYVDRGNIKQVSNFQTSINYDLTPNKLASLVVKYQRGRNLDTLESINLFTLGLGLKF